MKTGILRVSLLVVLAALSATGAEVTPKSEPVTIALWTEKVSIQEPVFQEWIADFQEEYPWILVELRQFDNELWEETLRTAMYGETPPDMFMTESRAELLEYVEAGLVYDLTDWYARYAERFIPGYELNSVIQGRRYAVPWTVHVLDLLWYNTAIMEARGLDPTTLTTWQELLQMCATLKQEGEILFAFGGGGAGWTGGHWVMFLLQKNLTPDAIVQLAKREKAWTDADVIAALRHFENLVKQGYLSPQAAEHDRDAGRALYFQGQGAFWQAGSWHLYQKGRELVPPDWTFAFIPFPNFADAPVRDVAISFNTSQWVIHQGTHHLEETLLLLEFLTRQTSAELWVQQAHGVVTVKGAVNARTAAPEMIAIARYLESANVETALEAYLPREVVQDGHWQGARKVLAGDITTEEWAQLIEELHAAAGPLMLE